MSHPVEDNALERYIEYLEEQLKQARARLAERKSERKCKYRCGDDCSMPDPKDLDQRDIHMVTECSTCPKW